MPTIKSDGTLGMFDNERYRMACNCALFSGEPLSGKTEGLTTLPPVRHIFEAPGELGGTTLIENEQQKVWVFDQLGSDTVKQWALFKKMVLEVIAGKHGEVTSIAIDGLHKLYDVAMKAHGYPHDDRLWGESAYGKGHNETRDDFFSFIKQVNGSGIKYRMATVYTGKEVLDEFKKAGRDNVGVFPDLPGMVAKRILGEYPFNINTVRTSSDGKEKYYWRLKTNGTVQAAGMHLPIHIKQAFPEFIEPNWAKVEELLDTHVSVSDKAKLVVIKK